MKEISGKEYQELLEKVKKLERENDQLKRENEENCKEQSTQDRAFLTTITNNMPGHIASVDAHTLKYQFVNIAFQESFGIPVNQIIGRHIRDIIGEDNYKFALKYIEIVKTGKSVSYENVFSLSTGERWIKVNYVPDFDEDGNVASIIVLSYDITEKKRAEIDLKINEEKYRVLIDESTDPIFSFSREGGYLYVNKAFARTIQKKQEYIIGRTIWDIFPEDEANKRYAILKKAFDTGVEQEIEVRVPIPAGDLYFITTVNPIKDKDGNVRLVICISKDITSRKNAELELQKSENYLKIANATKDKFFSIIAHDLKNPFNSIRGFSELLLTSINNYELDKIKEFVKAIHESSNNAYKLLENLLEWARSQTGKIEFYPEEILLKEILVEVVGLTDNLVKVKDISLNYEVPNGVSVSVDKNMLKVILRNLITNAIKFTEKGGRIVVEANQREDEVIIEVKDTGVGMTKEKVNNLFKIDEIISAKGTNDEKGTGLGLILCKEFVDKHKGKIWARSEIGKGSSFFFTLPMGK